MSAINLSAFRVTVGRLFMKDVMLKPITIYGKRDGLEFFLGIVDMPIHSDCVDYAQLMTNSRALTDRLCMSFEASTGRWCTLLCELDANNNPLTMLKKVTRNEWTLSRFSGLSKAHDWTANNPIWLFRGEINETAQKFSFRIFDEKLLGELFGHYENLGLGLELVA